MEKLQALRGMVDLMPGQINLWQKIEATARCHFNRAAITEIRTPLLETTELFSRGIGEATDVVGKEMYTFSDKGGRGCTLRPEGTASVVRASIQHGLINQGQQRLWYSGPMFRYERPQAGRQRQFHQIGLEYLGFDCPRSDVEAIAVGWDLLKALGIKKINLEINSLGNANDRVSYRNKLVSWLEDRQSQLDLDSQNRLKTNPLRILDSKSRTTQELLKNAPNLESSMSIESINRFQTIQSELMKLRIPFTVNPLLVRGLDYYTHTAFEITTDQLGAQSTICGGGRYDGLIEQLGGPPTSAIGWAIGVERLALLLSKIDSNTSASTPDFYVVNRGEKAESFSLMVARNLRLNENSVEIDLSRSAFSKQLKRADKSGAKWAIVIGDNEAIEEKVILKDLRSLTKEISNDKRISLDNLLKRFV